MTRRTNPDNRRQNLVWATPKAQETAKLLFAALTHVADTFVAGFTARDTGFVSYLINYFGMLMGSVGFLCWITARRRVVLA